MGITAYDIIILPLANTNFGNGGQKTILMPSMDRIPGRAIRGGLAGWAIKNELVSETNSKFKEIFHDVPTERFMVSFPFCHQNNMPPAPLSLFSVKGSPIPPRFTHTNKRKDAKYIWVGSDNELIDAHGCVDFLLRDVHPAGVVDVDFEKFSGRFNPYDGSESVGSNTEKLIALRSRHDRDTGRVGAGESEGGLFAEELLPKARFRLGKMEVSYEGRLVFDERLTDIFSPLLDDSVANVNGWKWDVISKLTVSPDVSRIVFLGRGRKPALIYAKKMDNSNPKISDNVLTVTFTSDYKTGDHQPFPLHQDMLANDIGLSSNSSESKARVFCASGESYEFDKYAANGDRMKIIPTCVAGSCARLVVTDLTNNGDDISKIRRASLTGIGHDTKNGFGRFVVNWSGHFTAIPAVSEVK